MIETSSIDSRIKDDLLKRPFRTFKDEKFYFGINKDKMIAQLKGLPGSIDPEINELGKSIHDWCESVKEDTIESFSSDTKESNKKFFTLLDINSRIETLKTMYTSDFTLQNIILLGIPLLASLVGLAVQVYSLYEENKSKKQLKPVG